jgi:hypothetical protein
MVIHYQSESEGVMQTIHVGGNINISFQRYQIMQKKTLNSFGASVNERHGFLPLGRQASNLELSKIQMVFDPPYGMLYEPQWTSWKTTTAPRIQSPQLSVLLVFL